MKFSLPVIAIILIATQGEDLDGLEWVAVIAGMILIAGAVIVVGIARSERFAVRFAQKITGAINWVLRKLNRDEIDEVEGRILEFRRHSIETVKNRWALALLAAVIGKLWLLVILTIAIRMVGISDDILSLWQIFVVWAIVMLITSIPITPGGIGIAALAYVWLFSGIIGEEWSDAIAAAVVLYRLAQWALPIAIGWPLIWYWRRQIDRGDLMDPFATAGTDAA